MNWKILKYNIGLMITLSGLIWGLDQKPELKEKISRGIASVMPLNLMGEEESEDPFLEKKSRGNKKAGLGEIKELKTKEDKKDKKEKDKKKEASAKAKAPLNSNVAYYPIQTTLGRSPAVVDTKNAYLTFSNQGISSGLVGAVTQPASTVVAAKTPSEALPEPTIAPIANLSLKTTKEQTISFSLIETMNKVKCQDLTVMIDANAFSGTDIELSGEATQSCSIKLKTSYNPQGTSPVSIAYGEKILSVFNVNFIPVTSLEADFPLEIPKGLKFPFHVVAKFSDNSSENVGNQISVDFDASIFASHPNDAKLEAVSSGTDAVVISFKEEELTKNITVLTHSGAEVQNPYIKAGRGLVYTNKAYTKMSNGAYFDLTPFVEWVSNDDSIAEVENSDIKLVTSGQTFVAFTFDAVQTKTQVEVTSATLENLDIVGLTSLSPWAETKYTAVAYFSDATSFDITDGVKWDSSEPNILALTENHALALTDGLAALTISSGEMTFQKDITVDYAEVVSIAVEPGLAFLGQNQKVKYKVMATYTNGDKHEVTKQSTWSSNNALVVIDDNGSATSGTTAAFTEVTLTANFKTFSGNTKVTINPATITSIYLHPTVTALTPGDKVQYKVYGVLNDKGILDLTAYSSIESLTPSLIKANAKVLGDITAVSTGAAQVQATFGTFTVTNNISVGAIKTITTPGTGLIAEYYNGNAFNTLKGKRLESQINHDMGHTVKVPFGVSDQYSIRWSGFIGFNSTGNIYLCTDSDDGIRVKLNNNFIINNWTDHGVTRNCSGAIPVTAGQKLSLVVEFYEKTGGAMTKLFWGASTGSVVIVPQSNLFPN